MLMIRPDAACPHDPGGRPADLVEAGQIDRQDPVPFVARELVDRHPVGHRVDARIVHQDVELAVIRDDAVDDGRDLVRFGHVERVATRQRGRLPPPRRQPVDVGVNHQTAIVRQLSAMAWPMPRAAPVTRLTLPDKSQRISCSPVAFLRATARGWGFRSRG